MAEENLHAAPVRANAFDPNDWIRRFKAAGGAISSQADGSISARSNPLDAAQAALVAELHMSSDRLPRVERASRARHKQDQIEFYLRWHEGGRNMLQNAENRIQEVCGKVMMEHAEKHLHELAGRPDGRGQLQ